jgi:hypothetical protein
MIRMKTILAALCAVLLSIGLTTTVPQAEAQDQFGLVNVRVGDITTGDILSNNNVTLGAAANIAANVCGINVNAALLSISQQLADNRNFTCSNTQTLRFVQVSRT